MRLRAPDEARLPKTANVPDKSMLPGDVDWEFDERVRLPVMSSPPELTIDPMVSEVLRATGRLGVLAGMQTVSVELGTLPRLQFVASLQSELVVPIQEMLHDPATARALN